MAAASGSARDGHSIVGRGRWHRATAALIGLVSVLAAVQAAAIGLGPATLSSGLGEPLRLSIPVTLQPDEDVGCVQVRPHGDDLPSVYNTRSQVLRSATRTRIEIQSPLAVDEPAIGLVVSVGCASPVARDYVLFLDPPVVAATAPAETTAAPERIAAPPPARAPSARPPRARPAPSDASVAVARPPRQARRRTPAPVVPATAADRSVAVPSTSSLPPPRAAAAPAPSRGDRLSVVPTEPPVIGRTSPSPQPGVFPPAVTGVARSGAAATGPAAPAPTAMAPSVGAATGVPAPSAPGGTPEAAGSAASPAPPGLDAAAQAREDALRQQQALLQSQIKNLGDQIALLRVQTSALAARNQALEASAFSPTLVWLLIALAVIAIIVAGWMAWRYTQLRRSLEGSAWWTGQTVQEGVGAADEPVVAGAGLAALDGATRSMARPPTPVAETRPKPVPAPVAPASSSSAQMSNSDRIRPAVRAPGSAYPAAMDTDFTVSDIEAAMATVRTVSPARPGKAPNPLEDSDFTGLGGPTITSPFSDQPPGPASATPAEAEEEVAHFVDLEIPAVPPPVVPSGKSSPGPSAPGPSSSGEAPKDIPPLDFHSGAEPPSFGTPRANSAAPVPPPAGAGASPDLDFKFEIPDDFDPLASDSLKTTLIEPATVDLEQAGAPEALDFELPSPTQIQSMTVFDRGLGGGGQRHGATALHDLFASHPGEVQDTVLDLADRDGAPLSTTEVDRLTAPEADTAAGVLGLSGHGRLVRLADLMTLIDEVATTDPLGAIASLRQYVLRDEHIPTLMWLRLFELYKIVDKRQVHDALAEHFARRYHRPMVGWAETLADRTPQRPLSALPQLDREIESQWGTEAGLLRLEHLLCDRSEDDAVVFNAILQRDLLDAAKIFPDPAEQGRPGLAAGAP